MKKDIEWLVQMINSERETLRQRFESGKGTPNETIFNEGRDWALLHVLRMIYNLDEAEVLSQELPVIPKHVADWIKEEQGTMSNWKLPSRFISDSKYKKDQRRYKWSKVEGNMDKFMSALINSYEVEEEPLHHALIKGHDVSNSDDIYWNYDKYDNDVFVSRLYPSHDNFSTEMSKSEWNGLGINDSNADFVRVGEME